MEQKIIIEANHLVKKYGDGEGLMFALNDVSIKVYEHEFLVILACHLISMFTIKRWNLADNLRCRE